MLRKNLLAVSLVLLFIGVVIVSATVNAKRRVKIDSEVLAERFGWQLDKTAGSWSISGNFSKGRKLRVVIQPGDWAGEPAPGYAYMELPVSIYDPHGGETRVKVVFTQPVDPFSPTSILQFDHVELESKGDGLTFEDIDKVETRNGTDWYNDLWAIVEFDGNYTVTIFRTFGVTEPPDIFKLESLVVGWEYPYRFFTFAGGCLIIVGLLLLLMWIRKRKQPKFRYKVKTNVNRRR